MPDSDTMEGLHPVTGVITIMYCVFYSNIKSRTQIQNLDIINIYFYMIHVYMTEHPVPYNVLLNGFFFISSNFTYNNACVLPVTQDEMGQVNEQV